MTDKCIYNFFFFKVHPSSAKRKKKKENVNCYFTADNMFVE